MISGTLADVSGKAIVFFSENWLYLWLPAISFFVLFGMTPTKAKGDENTPERFAIWMRNRLFQYAIFLMALPLLAAMIFQTSTHAKIGDGIAAIIRILTLKSLWLIPFGITLLILRFIFLRKLAPEISNFRKTITVSQTEDTLSDIREVGKDLEIKTFDPETYYKWDFIFLGIDKEDKPIYITIEVFLDNHLQILGGTGWGKGVLVGVIIDQLIWQNITVFYADPKDDENIAHIMYQRCLREGRKFTYFSFFDEEPGEWGPFLGGSLRDARTRLASAFGIGKDTGDNSAIHKSREVRMTRKALDVARDVDGIFKYCELEKEDSRITTELDTWRTYRTLCPKKGGFSIENSLTRGDVVYIKGSLLDPVITTGFKCMMTEAVQEIIRLKKTNKRKAVWLWDEYSFYVGPEAPKALASIRSAGMVFSLIYQSDQDARNLEDKSVNGNYVYNGINKNSQLKLVYGGWDNDNAKWISELSGTIFKDIAKMTEVEANAAAAETWSTKSMIAKEEEALLHTNLIKRLPKRVCVFLQPGALPKLCFTSFVPIKDRNSLPNYLQTLTSPTDWSVASAPAPFKPQAQEAALVAKASTPPSLSVVPPKTTKLEPPSDAEPEKTSPFSAPVETTSELVLKPKKVKTKYKQGKVKKAEQCLDDEPAMPASADNEMPLFENIPFPPDCDYLIAAEAVTVKFQCTDSTFIHGNFDPK